MVPLEPVKPRFLFPAVLCLTAWGGLCAENAASEQGPAAGARAELTRLREEELALRRRLLEEGVGLEREALADLARKIRELQAKRLAAEARLREAKAKGGGGAEAGVAQALGARPPPAEPAGTGPLRPGLPALFFLLVAAGLWGAGRKFAPHIARLLSRRRGLSAAHRSSATADAPSLPLLEKALFKALRVAAVVLGGAALLWFLGVPLLVLGTVLAVAAFAALVIAKDALRDIVSGIGLLRRGLYREGDPVELCGVFGRVAAVGLRTTVLKDPDGVLHAIPHRLVNAVRNYREAEAPAAVECFVRYDEDPDAAVERARASVREIAADPELGPFVTKAEPVIRPEAFETGGARLRIEVFVRPPLCRRVADFLAERLGGAPAGGGAARETEGTA